MNRTVALLAVGLLLLVGCGEGGAEPDAPSGRAPASLSLVLDFQPNAVHAGIYAAVADGADIEVREPGSSSDAPKLLEAGRVDLAIMDINDLGIARERGADIVGIGAIVQRPLAAVIAGDGEEIRTPADLAGKTIGVTGLPSDDAVLDTILRAGGVDPSEVDRQTIGFDSVPLLTAGRVDAATAFWNAEGVALREAGVPTREFRVDDVERLGYPELVLVTTTEQLDESPDALADAVEDLRAGYQTVLDDPDAGLEALLDAVPGLEQDAQRAQLDGLLAAEAFRPPLALDAAPLSRWWGWAHENGILAERVPLDEIFVLSR
jgi:NitT/TauT family transport system substrate-binding protein/putative hydroxymethylpyrimidine transport system substrate-binding protein